MSRLDRLFTLLSTSTSASARHLAAQQLGEVQKTYPDELHSLLSRLHPLLRSKRWETRIAAAAALTSILKEVKIREIKEEQVEDKTFQDFNLQEIIGNETDHFLQDSDHEEGGQASSEEQKRRLNAEMGLDVASKLGICQDLVTAEDLRDLSSREKNVQKRLKRKQAKDKVESCKKLKMAALIYAISDDQKESISWPFEVFVQYLRRDLKSSHWEERHGAATALREIIKVHGASYDRKGWMQDLAAELLAILARDRFGDFVSDQVVAPVRETSAMALANLMKLMPSGQMIKTIEILLQLSNLTSAWEARHGAFLGLKYFLCNNAVSLGHQFVVDTVYPRLFQGLKDVVDDVVSEAAAALVPVVKQFVHHIDVEELSQLLWNCLTDLDDLAGSTQSTMRLLSQVLTLKVPNALAGNALTSLVPRLFPFLHHSSSGVRSAALQTLVSLTLKSDLSAEFLPQIVAVLMSHLFQRSLLETDMANLKLIEEAWGQICRHCPLAALLTGTCPLYADWLLLISRPNAWPLPNELLIVKPKKEDHFYLGGLTAQQSNDELERSNIAARSRILGSRLLGQLAGYIAQPVPGYDYSKDPLTPIQMFVKKILLVNLSKSAFQCTTLGLLIMSWSHFHAEQVRSEAPQELKNGLWKVLNEDAVEFDEIGIAWQQIQTDASDLLATLKYHKIIILQEAETIPDKPSCKNIETLIQYELENDCKKRRIKPSRTETLVARQNDIKSRFARVSSDMTSLNVMTMSSLAGALVSLSYLPEKLNPVIKPLMESIKKEPIGELQKISAEKLVCLLDLCIQNKMPNPAEKVTRNLIHFAHQPEESIQSRGTTMALKAVATQFGAEVTSKPPKFFDRIILPFQQDHLWKGLASHELHQFLHTFQLVTESLHPLLHKELLKTFECLANILASESSICRTLSSQCFAALANLKANETISAVISHVIPKLDNDQPHIRQGAIEAMSSIVHRMDLNFIPYIVLFIVPVLGRMSDQDGQVRQSATAMFANLIKLIPLDSQDKDKDQELPKHLLDLKIKQRSFVDELTNLKNVQDIDIPVKINADLRTYQVDGVKWLSFLNRYNLHGILCDDMGLGKTLQSITMMSIDHHTSSKASSLIICPATLCYHWSSEIQKFATNLQPFVYSGSQAQRHFLRTDLEKQLQKSISSQIHLAVITSYEIVRSDIDMFKQVHWNYLVLDEGHAIRNAKTKTTLAIKSLLAHHRLILSGTPIQNSVIELWSLFDFLMPGFLGSEREFNAKYSKPIIGSRGSDSKQPSKENKEAGLLALDALHKQVLPFILRRMKEDVLKDLPPKITQDYYCELSAVQKLLYEDFAKEQKDKKKAEDKTHIFQALQYLRKVCNHPKLVLQPEHRMFARVQKIMAESGSTDLNGLNHATKLLALKQLLHECGIGTEIDQNSVVNQHRALVFCQLKAMMDIVETDLFKAQMKNVTYLRLDGSVAPAERHEIVTKFNNDVSIDLLLLSTSVGGLGLNLTGADTVIFVEHDWNPMKDLQAMDRAHRIGQKKVVNVYRLITRNTVEEKILGLQKFKLKTANSVITKDNSSLSSMATEQMLDLFSLDDDESNGQNEDEKSKKASGVKALLENLPELWDESQYTAEYNNMDI